MARDDMIRLANRVADGDRAAVADLAAELRRSSKADREYFQRELGETTVMGWLVRYPLADLEPLNQAIRSA